MMEWWRPEVVLGLWVIAAKRNDKEKADG